MHLDCFLTQLPFAVPLARAQLSLSLILYTQIKLVKSLYDCDYKAYLQSLVHLEELLKGDRFLAPHAAYWMRELHILAYHQFLESYSSVELTAMAAALGVSVDFLDAHASRYIAAEACRPRLTSTAGSFGLVARMPPMRNTVT